MLLPFDFAIITVEEANQLIAFIEKMTATKGDPRNYGKMIKLGVMELYDKLRTFVGNSHHYNHELLNVGNNF